MSVSTPCCETSSRVSRSPSGRGHPRGSGQRLRSASRAFLREEHGSVTVETAVAILVLVVALAALMEIVHTVYTDDRMARAARAAARALAVDPTADACAAIRRELQLSDDFVCATTLTLKVDLGVDPGALPTTLDAGVTANSGDLAVVRIGWNRDRWSFDGALRDADANDDAADTGTVSMLVLGLARCEADLCGQEAS